MKAKKKIVITGGPGSGKTSVINELKKQNYHCFDEVSRGYIMLGKENGIENYFKEDPLNFSKFLWQGRQNQYRESEDVEINSKNNWLFFDRGLPDVIAYLNFTKQSIKAWERELIKYPYDLFFLIPPEESIYHQDEERMESFDQAMAIHHELEQTYHSLGTCIEVPFLSIEDRANFVLDCCKNQNPIY